MATERKTSSSRYMMARSFSRFAGSLARFQGSFSTMCLLAAPTSSQMAMSALCSDRSAKQASTSATVFCASSGSLTSSAASGGAGIFPSQYLTAIVTERLTRLPRSLARSELSLATNASSEKLESRPNTMSRSRKYRKASRPYLSFRSSGRTTLPRLLDILLESEFQ